MNKIKFSKNRPKRSGVYLVRYDASDEYEIIFLSYSNTTRSWWTSDYPNSRGNQPLEEFDDPLWGPRLE